MGIFVGLWCSFFRPFFDCYTFIFGYQKGKAPAGTMRVEEGELDEFTGVDLFS